MFLRTPGARLTLTDERRRSEAAQWGWGMQLAGIICSFLASILIASSQKTLFPKGVFVIQSSHRRLTFGIWLLAGGFFLQGFGFLLSSVR